MRAGGQCRGHFVEQNPSQARREVLIDDADCAPARQRRASSAAGQGRIIRRRTSPTRLPSSRHRSTAALPLVVNEPAITSTVSASSSAVRLDRSVRAAEESCEFGGRFGMDLQRRSVRPGASGTGSSCRSLPPDTATPWATGCEATEHRLLRA